MRYIDEKIERLDSDVQGRIFSKDTEATWNPSKCDFFLSTLFVDLSKKIRMSRKEAHSKK